MSMSVIYVAEYLIIMTTECFIKHMAHKLNEYCIECSTKIAQGVLSMQFTIDFVILIFHIHFYAGWLRCCPASEQYSQSFFFVAFPTI